MITLFLPALLATPLVRDGKIINGLPASPGAYPYQVEVFSSTSLCGGSIIGTSFVLTAAHCSMPNVADFKILAGSVSRSNYAATGQLRLVSKFKPHPNYSSADNGFDIAVVKVTQPFVYNSYVKAISMNSGSTYPAGTFTATGWGLTVASKDSSLPDILQYVVLNQVSYSVCAAQYGGLPSGVLCAAAPGKDACQGDSGGPLALTIGGKVVQVGITSFGQGCADPRYSGVYTNVGNYYNWVNQVVATL